MMAPAGAELAPRPPSIPIRNASPASCAGGRQPAATTVVAKQRGRRPEREDRASPAELFGAAAVTGDAAYHSVTIVHPPWPGDPDTPHNDRTDDKWTLTDNQSTVRSAACTDDDGDELRPFAYSDAASNTIEPVINVFSVDQLRYGQWTACTDAGAMATKKAIIPDADCPEDVTSCDAAQ